MLLLMSRLSVIYTSYIYDNEQYATVGVLRDLINCLDGLYDIYYLNYDDITVIIDELCTNYYALAIFICTYLYSVI